MTPTDKQAAVEAALDRFESAVMADNPLRKTMARLELRAILAEPRPCTCHPDDNPPVPCPRKYALSECRAAAPSPTPTTGEPQELVDALNEFALSQMPMDPDLAKLMADNLEDLYAQTNEPTRPAQPTPAPTGDVVYRYSIAGTYHFTMDRSEAEREVADKEPGERLIEVFMRPNASAEPRGLPDYFPAAARLALELECLLLSCSDTAAVSKWWDSAHEALDQWRNVTRSVEDERESAKAWASVRSGDITHADEEKKG